ncbi:MAG: PrgI family protein [bacterium]|nr:PrgI family protein [bacterium]
MRFQVPQFINIEDKLFGPLTVKQFIYVVGAGGMIYILYHYLPFFIAIIFIAPIALLALALAFATPNGKPFVFTLQAALQYALGNRLYLWKKKPHKPDASPADKAAPQASVPALAESKLKDLTWSLDINEKVRR